MKLRPRIALVSCLAALASVGVTGALLIRESRKYAEEQVVARQLLLVQNRAFALGDSLELASRELIRLSRMAEVDLTDNDLRPEAALLAHAHRNSTLFNIGLQILDASGRCLWSEPATPGCGGQAGEARSYGSAPWLVAGRRASTAVVMSGHASGEPSVMNVVVPIGGTPGAAAGVLRGIIDLRTDRIVSPAIKEALPDGTEVAVVSANGRAVYPDLVPASPGWTQALGRAAQGAAGTFTSVESAQRWLFAHAPVAHAGWGLVFRWRWSDLDVGLSAQRRLLFLILAAGGALAILLGLTSSGYLTRPLQALVASVRHAEAALGKPQADGPAPEDLSQALSRSDELGELSRAFRELQQRLEERDARHQDDLRQIRELASSLEERVRARTRELSAAQESLLAQERLAAMGQAAAVISHELKNSLGALGMGVDLLVGSPQRAGDLSRVHTQMRAEVARLRNMTDELLVFARTPRLSARQADLHEVVRRAVALCEEPAASLGVQLEVRLGQQGPLVLSLDEERIQSVIVNLIQNGLEAVAFRADGSSGAPALVRVGTQLAQGDEGGPSFAEVVVEDAGPGVSAEARARMFEPFFTTKRNGTGLGLATAQRFVGAHGGRLVASTSGLGGARFSVLLPLQPRGAAAAVAAPSAPGEARGLS